MIIGSPVYIPRRTEAHGPQDFYEWGVALYLSQNYDDGCEYLRLAATHDHGAAEYRLGYACRNGRGENMHLGMAKRFFIQSILHGGNADAMFTIGLMYSMGERFPENNFLALFWLRRSLNNEGPPEAAYNMAEIYRTENEYRDLQQAANYYQIAHDGGHPDALVYLRLLNEQGFVPNIQVD